MVIKYCYFPHVVYYILEPIFFFFLAVAGLSCSMWDLVSYQGSNLGLRHWKHGSLSHWITGEVPREPILLPIVWTSHSATPILPLPPPYWSPPVCPVCLCVCFFSSYSHSFVIIFKQYLPFSDLLHLAQCSPRPSMLLQMAKFFFFLTVR